MKNKFTIAGIQLSFSAKPEENEKKTLNWVKKAAKKGAQIICLPELYRTQYFCQKEDFSLFDLAETIPGPSTKTFQKAAKENKVAIVLPIFEKRAAGVYHNSVVMIDADGSILGIYRKMHIPDDPAFYEKYYFTPGDLGFKAFKTKFGKVGSLICWDQWYPEGARITALQGASVLFYPTAIGWHPAEKERYGKAQQESWITIQRAHAIANGVYVCSVNRIGLEQPVKEQAGIEFWGNSFICDPQGVVIAEASSDKEEIILAEVDLKHLETIRRNWPFLRDRRIDAYSDITKRFLD
ncbi:MAG: acyltransferase [Stygiobacter sp. RIFOXYC12_FULL_38_8]|nr:MAG: acyltransferase [Stygiobacter sp. GWC2_38_9]OGU86047.1 MAG: acyltransferase [Stygiobacter sp. RIFOXYA12_FULL_38_9]OGV07384.1 MAG: acyltransferase [Stygiobacter sp. RIFOXYB2_FULL_37_11]OGV14687.1 MAG: acyltransferase [Stygiobacter sp. RIFOXYC2_FULL_38_25]OGV25135.1 MAG: acyltransferase [Stygiobacter sp. RIFOXYC12_FULL_38_8]OGV79180.1 MAG: acyltransferase [Stygiobacter sp. GWF2_38_21]